MTSVTLKKLGKYTLDEVLGEGSMGIVYKGRDPHIGRPVAIKTIRRDIGESSYADNFASRFTNEAKAAGRLTHPGIVAIYEYGEEGPHAYIVMEFVEGNDLGVYFQRGCEFPIEDVVGIMAQLLDALEHAHNKGIVHRDIKPSNIIMMRDGKLKVADFGIAHIDSSELTQMGSMMGTPAYMAPEQFRGASTVDGRADIFSAGVILYQLFTGEKPFTGSTEVVSYKICFEEPRRPSEIAPARCSPLFETVVLRALAKTPVERFPSARAFADAIVRAYGAPAQASVSEKTVILEHIRRHPQTGVESASSTGRSTGSSGFPTLWEPTVLQQVEQRLTRIVGPLARVMIKKAAREAADIETLYQLLTAELPQQDRKAFLATRRGIQGVAEPPTATRSQEPASTQAPAPGPPLAQQTIDEAAQRLAPYLGPLARVLARKLAPKAASTRDFYLLLAENLSDPKDRSRFLEDAGIGA